VVSVSLAAVRRGTFITIVVLFALLVAALIYQLTLGGRGTSACGPATPNALPTKGACPAPTPTPGAT
jgi:hypothetical protein